MCLMAVMLEPFAEGDLYRRSGFEDDRSSWVSRRQVGNIVIARNGKLCGPFV